MNFAAVYIKQFDQGRYRQGHNLVFNVDEFMG